MKLIGERVECFLQKKHPLWLIDFKEIYDELFQSYSNEPNFRPRVREAVYARAAGASQSQRNTRPYYAIRISVESNSGSNKDIYFSLPGIPREKITYDNKSAPFVKNIQTRLQEKYGKQTINYWVKSAQRRSVDVARDAMEKAKIRDGNQCRLCVLPDVKQGNNKLVAAHIISRKVIYWEILEEVDKEGYNLFSDEGVLYFLKKLKENELHSHEQYIITLCTTHDKLLLKTLQSVVSEGKKNKSEIINSEQRLVGEE